MLAQLIVSESDLFKVYNVEKSTAIQECLSSMIKEDSDFEIRYLANLILEDLEKLKNGRSMV